ncbi:MAG: stimulus-sensing domain-containing protein [Proteobacteria bacterium]|nr:stimulus-sensing domain-containing protein [Pseudomonadota bacterium]
MPPPEKKSAYSARRDRRGGLTLRILAVNIVAPLILVIGVLYMGQYRDGLIKAEMEILQVQAQLFAGAIAEGAVRPVEKGTPFLFARPEEIETLVPELSRRIVRRMGETTKSRTRLFDVDGELIGDSQQLSGPGGTVSITPLGPPAPKKITLARILSYLGAKAMDALPNQTPLQPYPYTASDRISHYPDAAAALKGIVSVTAWKEPDGRIMLTAGAPVQKEKQTMGVVLLMRDGSNIEAAMADVRSDVLIVFMGTLSITIFLSMYLAGMIGRPLKRLARAAEAIRTGKNRSVDIPDMSRRGDEIGDLSLALREMTQALWDRMDTIDRFAADVAHEIKNPLTSLRSAVETVMKVRNEQDRTRLLDIIQHDVQRLDRLISDISNASRLDEELSRDEMGTVDLRAMLEQLSDIHRAPMERGGGSSDIVLEIPQKKSVSVRGNEGRLAQVFENLIGNALSFSPSGAAVLVRVLPDTERVKITVEDEGPGIPENKLEAIFERFYSERPQHEDFGAHSGLGLSIAKQIVIAHGGELYAENLKDGDGKVAGACFTVILEAAI